MVTEIEIKWNANVSLTLHSAPIKMDRVARLRALDHIPPQGTKAKYIRKHCVTGSQAGSLLSYPVQKYDLETWSEYATDFGPDPKIPKHGYIGYRSLQDLWRTRQGLDSFNGNEATEWGNKMEGAALLLYEIVHRTKIHEFGILPDAEISWLYISPDAISEQGRMVEIKCPLWREIKDDGWLSREYWSQAQLQLRVCNSYKTNVNGDAFETPPFSLDFCQNKFIRYPGSTIHRRAIAYLRDRNNSRDRFLTALEETHAELDASAKRVHLISLPIKGAIVQLSRTTSIIPPASLISTDDEMVVWALRTARAVRIIRRFILRQRGCDANVEATMTPVEPIFWRHVRMTVTHIKENPFWFSRVEEELRVNNENAQVSDFFKNVEKENEPPSLPMPTGDGEKPRRLLYSLKRRTPTSQ